MSVNWFYLHFRRSPSARTLELLRNSCLSLDQVFETSYDVCVEMSAASFKHLLKENAPDEEYDLVKVKNTSEISPRKRPD